MIEKVNDRDRINHRKEVWRAVRMLRAVLQIAPADREMLLGLKPGITVYADERSWYCDGRVTARTIGQTDGREVLYIPLIEPEETEVLEA